MAEYEAFSGFNRTPGDDCRRRQILYSPVSGKIDNDAPKRQQVLLPALRTVSEPAFITGGFCIQNLFKKMGWIGKPASGYARWLHLEYATPSGGIGGQNRRERQRRQLRRSSRPRRLRRCFDVAYLVTNDTDLVEPIRIVTQEVCVVGVVFER